MTVRGKKAAKLIVLHITLAVSVSLALFVVYLILGTPCVFKGITGIDCPFCGMTRAHLSLLHGDFSRAFAYNPLFPLGIPFLMLIFHQRLLRRKNKKLTDAAVIGGAVVFIAADAVRIFFS